MEWTLSIGQTVQYNTFLQHSHAGMLLDCLSKRPAVRSPVIVVFLRLKSSTQLRVNFKNPQAREREAMIRGICVQKKKILRTTAATDRKSQLAIHNTNACIFSCIPDELSR